MGRKKVHIFSLNQRLGNVNPTACVSQCLSVWDAKSLSLRRARILYIKWKWGGEACCKCSKNRFHQVVYIPGYKSSGPTGRAYTCRQICWGRRDYNEEKQGGRGRATKPDTKESARQTQTVRNKKKEVL